MPHYPRRLAATLALLIGSACHPAGAASATDIPPAAEAPPAGFDVATATAGDRETDLPQWIATHYDKREVRIPMRDGVSLFTAIYTPKQTAGPVPMMLLRTPYAVGPYGSDAMPDRLGPSETLARKGWVFVYQDVRGRFMSEGEFVDMRPHIDDKTQPSDIDESSDTYDTIAWLLEHVEGHNGRVGQWGISYPGFYAAAGMIDAHPALRAVSPQAPIADWYFDDFHHHGAFFLPHAFNFLSRFGLPRPKPTTEWGPRFDHGTPDGYAFFLALGPLRNANARHLHGEVAFWDDLVAHPDYDAFWQARNLLPHLHAVAPAVLTVGGLFDAEDLYGPMAIYETIERGEPGVDNRVVLGPWRHGGWARTAGDHLGQVSFGAETGRHYREAIEAPFFVHHLADGPDPGLPEASVFSTGDNRWRRFDQWPPAEATPQTLWLSVDGGLGDAPPTARAAAVGWRSDPAHPVPYTAKVTIGMDAEYMTEDQRFAARRPDVVTFQTEPLSEALTLAGPVTAKLWVSTSGTATDVVVKLIDVFPDDAPDATLPDDTIVDMRGYQMMVRSEVMRGRYRDGYEHPKPFVANRATEVDVPLQAVMHTFAPGHRVMVQVQSTWFPLVDLNPHHYVANVFEATAADFVPAQQRLLIERAHPSRLELSVLPAATSAPAG
jgi:putative CocE/NonD family hydrolase